MKLFLNRGPRCILLSALAAGLFASVATAQPQNPVYDTDWTDCDTSDNQFIGDDGMFFWDVDPGCDVYQQDEYERPMTQTFFNTVGRYGAVEYFEYLDLLGAEAGFDSDYLYVRLTLAGRDHLTSDGGVDTLGMVERYGFRLSTDPDGRFGVLIVSDQPELKNDPNTVYGPIGTFGYRDTDGDVGGADRNGPTGLTVTKSDNPDEEGGTLNGYDSAFISDGRLNDETPVLWVRLNPQDDTQVEFALDYEAVGFTQDDLRSLGYLHFEAIKGGPKDPQNYLWNDKYTKEESGSPNPGAGGESEFGTEGLENVYEVDSLAGSAIDGNSGGSPDDPDQDDPDQGDPGQGGSDEPDQGDPGQGGQDGSSDDDQDSGSGSGDSGGGGRGFFCGSGSLGAITLAAIGLLTLRSRRFELPRRR